jgi:hypothetical protein
MVRIEATFLVLEEDGPAAKLECPRCGCEFEVNAYSGENLIIDPQQKCQLAVCPLCGTVEKADSSPVQGAGRTGSLNGAHCQPEPMARRRCRETPVQQREPCSVQPSARLWDACTKANQDAPSPWGFAAALAVLIGLLHTVTVNWVGASGLVLCGLLGCAFHHLFVRKTERNTWFPRMAGAHSRKGALRQFSLRECRSDR